MSTPHLVDVRHTQAKCKYGGKTKLVSSEVVLSYSGARPTAGGSRRPARRRPCEKVHARTRTQVQGVLVIAFFPLGSARYYLVFS